MRKIYLLLLVVLSSSFLYAQKVIPQDSNKVAPTDTIVPGKGAPKEQIKEIKQEKVKQLSDSSGGNEPKKSPLVDTTVQNKYGDWLNDDTLYNKKYSLWKPALGVISANIALSLADSRILHLGFSKVNVTTWNRTLRAGWPWGPGWEWDQDRFGNNFLSHPIMGNFYFNAARSNGYNFLASAGFAFAGSYMWKIFGENGTPEREDIVNTTVDGMLLGEILYRISSNILDDRTTGSERTFREILAGVVDPMRGVNRLLQGKTFRHINKEVYQKEPLNFSFFGGFNKINAPQKELLTGSTSEMLNLQFDYGNPFEVISKKPFDFFKLRVEMNYGIGRKFVDNVTGYGILFGKNDQIGKLALLHGGFLYYDYWDNTSFELSTIALGYGGFSKLPLSKTSNLYTNAHIGIIPLAGNSSGQITDTSQSRDYSFGYGWEGKFEALLSLGDVATVSFTDYYFIIHNFNNTGRDEPNTGTLGNNFVNILKPRITFQIYKNFSVGYEHYQYNQTHNENNYPTFTSFRTEDKIFLLLYVEDKQRKGHYQ